MESEVIHLCNSEWSFLIGVTSLFISCLAIWISYKSYRSTRNDIDNATKIISEKMDALVNVVRGKFVIAIIIVLFVVLMLIIHNLQRGGSEKQAHPAPADDPIEARELYWSMTSESLREKGFYHFRDANLAYRLGTELSITHPDGDEESAIERANRLNLALKGNPLIAVLRDRARRYKPPFQYIGTPVRVRVPDGNQPRSTIVFVAFESDLDGKVVQIRNPDSDRQLTLRAIGAYHSTTAVDIQMNTQQVQSLFGRADTTVHALAFVLPSSSLPENVSGDE